MTSRRLAAVTCFPSDVADPSERFLAYADLSDIDVTAAEVAAEARQKFNHRWKLSGYHNPFLVMHAEHDGLIDISHAERNYQWAAGSPANWTSW